MQIVCPNCRTTYQIAAEAVGEGGRSVRCVRCQTVWFAAPPAMAMEAVGHAAAAATEAEPPAPPEAEPPSVPEGIPSEPLPDEVIASNPAEESAVAADGEAGTAPVAFADVPIPVEDAPPLVPASQDGAPPVTATLDENGPPDIESVAARRARTAARRRRNRLRIPLPAAIAALVILCAGLIGWRKDIVRHAPQLASFYSALGLPVNLRGLVFTDMKIGNEIHDGVPVLVVEGLIVSTVSMPVDVPRLRFSLRNASGAEIYAWTAQPSQPVLGPYESLPFRSRLASPPAEGHDIQVRFFTRRDAVAGPR